MDKDLAHTFRLARKLIKDDQFWYICEALRHLYEQGEIAGLEYERARDLIQQRLGEDALTVEAWLERNVPDGNVFVWAQDPDSILKDYRLRWLDSLVEEFA